jgi:4-oxalocrotonate tautomerase
LWKCWRSAKPLSLLPPGFAPAGFILLRRETTMPAITIQSLELTEKQKEYLADKIIALFSEVTHVPPDRIYLFFDGYTLDNVATNKKLMSQNPPKAAIGKFNQEREEEIWTSIKA